MARALKWVLIVIAVLVLLLVTAVVAVTVLVDPNDYKDEISHAVEKHTGRTLTIKGDIDLKFFPWLGLKLGETRLSDAPGFGDEPFAKINDVQLAVAVWPLLSERRLVLDKIVIDGLGLRLVRDEKGRGNWEDLAERFASDEKEAAPSSPKESDGLPVEIESKGGLELRNATVLWDDRQAGTQYLLSPFGLSVAELNLDAPIPLRAQWTLKATDLPEVMGDLAARVLFDQRANTLAVQDLTVNTTLRGDQIPAGELATKLRGEVQADLAAQRFALSQTTLELADIVVTLAADAHLQGEELLANATVTLPTFNARESLRQLQIELPDMSDASALTKVGLATRLQYSNKGLVLEELKAQLDDSNLTGQAQLPSFDPLTAQFQFALDQIDLDRYLPPEQEKSAAPSPAPEGEQPAADEVELPLEMLRELVLDGSLAIGQVIVKKMRMTDIEMKITARDGLIRAEPLATLYQGKLQGEMTLDARTDDPTFSMQQRLAGVQAGSLLEDLVGVARILGVADLSLDVGMHGAGVDDWLQTANGTGSFKFSDGAINGINIADAIQSARAKLANEPATADSESGQTPFNVLQGTLKIEEGLVMNRDFDLSSSMFEVAGDGQFSLLTQGVDYTLKVSLLEPLLKSDNKLLSELRNVPIPVQVSGDIRDLKVGVNLQEAIGEAGKARLKEEVQERREEVESKVQEKVQDKLKDLLKKRD